MKIKKSSKKWNELPEIITPIDYADVVGIGEIKAREIFKKKEFPRVPGTGTKQLAYRDLAKAYSQGIDVKRSPEIVTMVELNKTLVEFKELFIEFIAQYERGGKTNE